MCKSVELNGKYREFLTLPHALPSPPSFPFWPAPLLGAFHYWLSENHIHFFKYHLKIAFFFFLSRIICWLSFLCTKHKQHEGKYCVYNCLSFSPQDLIQNLKYSKNVFNKHSSLWLSAIYHLNHLIIHSLWVKRSSI